MQDSKMNFKTIKRKTSDSQSPIGSKERIVAKPVPFTAGGPPMQSGKNSMLNNKLPASVLEEESMLPGSMQD